MKTKKADVATLSCGSMIRYSRWDVKEDSKNFGIVLSNKHGEIKIMWLNDSNMNNREQEISIIKHRATAFDDSNNDNFWYEL